MARWLAVACLLIPAPRIWALDSQQALQEAADLVQQGRLQEADQQAQKALADPQTRAAAYSVLGTIRLQQKRLTESAGFLQQAIRLEPNLIGARLSLAEVYSLQKKPQQAAQLYRQALDLDPSNLAARFALARAESRGVHYRIDAPVPDPAFDGHFVLRPGRDLVLEHWT